MRHLPTTYSKSGYDYALLDRSGDVALFSQALAGRVIAYEVVVVQYHKATVIMGKPVPEREGVPSAEQWGSAGWTLRTPEEAKTKMQTVLAERAEKARAA